VVWAAGTTLRITNEGHHWQIADGGFLAEWWPSSAKLVIGKNGTTEFVVMTTSAESYREFLQKEATLIGIAGMKFAAALQQLIRARFIY
jgi:hypothetical protein